MQIAYHKMDLDFKKAKIRAEEFKRGMIKALNK